MNKRTIPLLSLESCSRAITEHTDGKIIDYAGHTSYSAPGCISYSRNYIYEPDDERFGEEFYDIASEIKELTKAGNSGMFTFIREEAPEDFETRLSGLGAKRRGPQTGMLLNIDYFEELPESENVRIITEEEIDEWETVDGIVFAEVKKPEPGLFRKYQEIEGVDLYAYFEDGKIVGTSMLITEGDLSGIHEVTVLPEFRGRGAATAMVRAMINDLKKKKIRVVSLQASPMGLPVYEKLGFESTGHIETWRF